MIRIITVLSLLILTAMGCTSPGIRTVESNISEDLLEDRIGLISVGLQVPGETYFNFIIKKTREGIIDDNRNTLAQKNNLVAHLNHFKYKNNQYFLFRIRHTKSVHRQKGFSKFSFVDANKKSVISKILDTTIKWSGDGTMYEQIFLFKTVKPVTRENFSESVSPLKFSAQFMKNQKQTYSITPN